VHAKYLYYGKEHNGLRQLKICTEKLPVNWEQLSPHLLKPTDEGKKLLEKLRKINPKVSVY
jgi:hypothetical protein